MILRLSLVGRDRDETAAEGDPELTDKRLPPLPDFPLLGFRDLSRGGRPVEWAEFSFRWQGQIPIKY